MNFKKAIPVAPVYHNKVLDMTIEEVKEIVFSDKGRMVLSEHLDKERKKNTDSMIEEVMRKFKENERKFYDYICSAYFLKVVDRIENIYSDYAKDESRKGFMKSRLSVDEIVAGLIEKSSEYAKSDDLCIDFVTLGNIYNHISERYGYDLQFINPEFSKEMQIELVSPYEDESIFETGMTLWEAYTLGTTNADVANNIINSISWIEVLEEYEKHKFTPNVICGLIGKANKIIEKMCEKPDMIQKSVKKLNKIGFTIPEGFAKTAENYIKYEYAYQTRWKWK